MIHHALVLVDRSKRDKVTHRHRWEASCPCGWSCIPLRVKKSAVQQYRNHQKSKGTAQPRPVTPDHLLPEAWRT